MQDLDLIAELERRIGAVPAPADDLVSQLERRLQTPIVAPEPQAPTQVAPEPLAARPTPPVTPVARRPPAPTFTTGPLPTTPMASHAPTTPLPIAGMAPVASHGVTPAEAEQIRQAEVVARHPIAGRIPIVRDIVGGAEAGAANMAESVAGLGNWLGVVPDEWLQASQQATGMVTPQVMTERISSDPAGTLGNPAWWATQGGQALASMAALGSVGTLTKALTAMRFAPAVAAAIVESMTEGGSTYSQARQQGATPEQAGAAAAKVVAVNLPLLGVSNVPVLGATSRSVVRNLVKAAASESGQEVAQQVVSNAAARGYNPNQSLTEGVLESGLVGGVAGAGAHALVAGHPVQQGKPSALPVTPTAPAAVGQSPLTIGQKIAKSESDAARIIAGLEQRVQAPVVAPAAAAATAGPVDVIAALEQRLAQPVEAAPAGSGETAAVTPTPQGTDATVTPDATPEPSSRDARIDAAVNATTPKTFAELLPIERREVRRVLAEMHEQTFQQGRMQKIPWWEEGFADARYMGRQANAPVFHGIKGDKSRTAKAIRTAGDKYVAGTGRATTIVADLVKEARKRIYEPDQSVRALLPEDAGAVPGEIYVKPRRYGEPDAAKELETIRSLDDRGPAIAEEYEQRFGRVFNADNVSEVLGVHEGETRWAHHDAVRSSASAVTQALYDQALAEPPDPKQDVVVVLGGGTGSGKSTFASGDDPGVYATLDSTLADEKLSEKNIRAAVASGRPVEVRFVYRDPIEAFVEGVIPRSTSAENGRPVTAATHASTHVHAPRTFLSLADKMGDEFLVGFEVIENTTGGAPVVRDPAWLKQQIARYNDVDELRSRLEAVLAAQVATGRLTPAAARRLGASENRGRAGDRQGDRQPEGRRPEARSSQKADDVAPRRRASSDRTVGEPITTDRLSTGEEQPRLPGDVGAVRDQEIPQPKVAEIPEKPFELTNQTVKPKNARQATLFEHINALGGLAGSPTRMLYQPSARPTPVTPSKGRPISEQETVNRMREILSVDRVTPGWLRRVLGTAKAAYPLRFGKVSANSFGHYQTDTGLIRLKRAYDLTTFSHEVGHMVDYRMFGRTPPYGLFRQELLHLGAATTPKSKIGSKYHIGEGVAEYFRVWFADPGAAKTVAPQFTAAFEAWMEKHPTAEAQLHAAQAVVIRYLDQPTDVRGRARVNVQPSGVLQKARTVVDELRATKTGGFVQRFAQALKATGNLPAALKDPHRWFDTLLTHWIDSDTAIARAVVDMAAGQTVHPTLIDQRTGKAVTNVHENAYILTRLAKGTSGMTEGFLKHGPRGLNGQFVGASLEQTLQGIRHRLYPTPARTTPDFATYLVALRALELHTDGKGRWPGLSPDEARTIIRQTHADPEAQAFKDAAAGVHSYLKGLRQYALVYGMISPQLDAKLGESLFYVPLQRVMDEAERRLGASRIANRVSPIKRLVGSGRDIIDPIESIVRNTETLVNAVEKNRAAAALVEQARDSKHAADWIVKIPTPRVASTFNLSQLAKDIEDQLQQAGVGVPMTTAPGGLFNRVVTAFLPATFGDPGDRIITVVEGGERQFYQVQDEALYQNITNLGVAPTGEVLKWAAKPTAVLRAGATLRPSFIVRNLLRDTVGAMLQSRHGFVPVYDSFRGLIGQLRQDEDFKQFQAFGVQSAAQLGQDRDRVRAFIDKMATPSDFKAKVRMAVHPLQLLRLFSEQIETATRLGEFKLALDTAGRERRAGVLGIAQRLGDRGKGRTPVTESTLTTAALAARDVTVDFGRGGRTAKELSQFKAFFNARVQGYARIAETVQRDPQGAALTVGALAALGAALWRLNRDDDEYQELSAQQKRDYWFVKLPGAKWFLTIPKPFEWALVPNIVEAALDDRMNAGDMMGLGDATDVVLTLTPTAILPALEAITNYDSFRRRPIVSPWDADKDPDLQVRDWTSDTARAAALPIKVSPAKLEHVLYGYGGGLARDAAGLTDPIARLLSGRNKPPSPQPPITRQVPGLSAIARGEGFDSSAKSIQDFYETFSAFEGARNSLRLRGKGEGMRDAETERQAFVAKYPQDVAARLTAGKNAIDDIRDDISAVRGSRTMTPPQKTAEIAALNERLVDVARRALGRPPLTRHRITQREMAAAR
jgi:hypothetical protein